MATAPATPIGRNRRELVEAKAPEMFKFTRVGQEISGVLIQIEPTVVKQENGSESHTVEYMLMNEKGDRLTFLGTNDLNKKMEARYIGHFHSIRYEKDDNSFTKPGQSAAKIFKVLRSPEKEPGF